MARNRTQPKKQIVRKEVNFWEFLRAVFVPAINKGQVVQVGLALIFMISIYKMPADDVSKLMFKFIDGLETGRLLGWILAVLSLIGWSLHAKAQRRWWTPEISRVSDERNKVQAIMLEGKIQSSDEK